MHQEPIDSFADALEPMTEDEVFSLLSRLERDSEKAEGEERDEVMARITLVTEEIERRYPGQVLAPYRAWKSRDPLA
ncbi:hypothetical protein BJF93_08850 [Xaviernesmea oryzae]|uniref:Uncharacterized protein n=1 Tax=Xaviernesmea oryzae TaxID=464029 RepID=A0A1Q9B167_9HYPH|nr:hypothetical protein [Xaviernesmea oryzae]OLP61698.1 hypothetical protein BJF93_08850 [Xaviernesmea oryzae]SEL02083.1 hypothetical protein SAMN04487976_105154 [Xaviernesmea oryzae]